MARLPKTELNTKIKNYYISLMNQIKFIKAIDLYCKLVVSKDTKRLENNDYQQIATCLRGRDANKFQTIMVRRMIEDVQEIKDYANNALQQYLLNNGFNEVKIKDLLEKAELKAEKTSDYMNIARFIKESALDNVSNSPKVIRKETVSLKTIADNLPDKVTKTQTISIETIDKKADGQ
jgi:hypothetical protein